MPLKIISCKGTVLQGYCQLNEGGADCFINSSSIDLLKFANLVDLLMQRATEQNNTNAYTFLCKGELEAEEITYQELEQRAKAIAARLQALGYQGKPVLLIYPSGLEFIAAFFGCLYAGVIAVPAYPPTRREQTWLRLQSIVSDSQAVVALGDRQTVSKLSDRWKSDSQMSSLNLLVTDDIDVDLSQDWQYPDINSDTLAFLQYTSGSTGKPKGVMVTHGNLLHNSALIYQYYEHTSESKVVSWLPLYHDMGLIGGVLQPLYGGFPAVLMSPAHFMQKPRRWLQAISRHQATSSGGPNFAFDLCVQKINDQQKEVLDLSSWDVAFTGAETIRAETLERFANAFAACGFRRRAFYPCYGMAETTLMASGGRKEAAPVILTLQKSALEKGRVVETDNQELGRSLVGCGQNLSTQKIVIAAPQELTACPDDQIGEIWVSGESVAQGYWHKAEVTENTFKACLADTGEGPFLRTGDLGFCHNGELFVTGRVKDLIIVRGQNYYPQDIELTIQNSHPALEMNSGAAFAVEIKNAEQIVVVQEVKRSYLRQLNVTEIIWNIRKAVAREHDLQVYAVALLKPTSIPKTSSGKIMRHVCKQSFLNGKLEVIDDWSEDPQNKKKFLELQTDVDLILQKLKQ